MNNKIAYTILAAGKGTRMKDENLPKPLTLLASQPLIKYILATLKSLRTNEDQIWLVVHHQEDQIKAALGHKYQYVQQKVLDGTAGALSDALEVIPTNFQTVAVFQADDSMFYQPKTISNFISQFTESHSVMSLITLKKNSPKLGSLIRDKNDLPQAIWSESKCFQAGLLNKELVTGAYIFDRSWVQKAIPKLKADIKGEIGLPYLIEIAYQENKSVSVFNLENPSEWASVNTPEELAEAKRKLVSR